MFGIGGIEFVIIAIVTVLVVGPKELPTVLYNVGKAFSKFREYSNSLTQGFDAIAREGELQDIVTKANKAGDSQMSFREEQQRAIEARRAAGEDIEDIEPDDDEIDGAGISDDALDAEFEDDQAAIAAERHFERKAEIQKNKEDIIHPANVAGQKGARDE